MDALRHLQKIHQARVNLHTHAVALRRHFECLALLPEFFPLVAPPRSSGKLIHRPLTNPLSLLSRAATTASIHRSLKYQQKAKQLALYLIKEDPHTSVDQLLGALLVLVFMLSYPPGEVVAAALQSRIDYLRDLLEIRSPITTEHLDLDLLLDSIFKAKVLLAVETCAALPDFLQTDGLALMIRKHIIGPVLSRPCHCATPNQENSVDLNIPEFISRDPENSRPCYLTEETFSICSLHCLQDSENLRTLCLNRFERDCQSLRLSVGAILREGPRNLSLKFASVDQSLRWIVALVSEWSKTRTKLSESDIRISSDRLDQAIRDAVNNYRDDFKLAACLLAASDYLDSATWANTAKLGVQDEDRVIRMLATCVAVSIESIIASELDNLEQLCEETPTSALETFEKLCTKWTQLQDDWQNVTQKDHGVITVMDSIRPTDQDVAKMLLTWLGCGANFKAETRLDEALASFYTAALISRGIEEVSPELEVLSTQLGTKYLDIVWPFKHPSSVTADVVDTISQRLLRAAECLAGTIALNQRTTPPVSVPLSSEWSEIKQSWILSTNLETFQVYANHPSTNNVVEWLAVVRAAFIVNTINRIRFEWDQGERVRLDCCL